jgi:hypothetical protein
MEQLGANRGQTNNEKAARRSPAYESIQGRIQRTGKQFRTAPTRKEQTTLLKKLLELRSQRYTRAEKIVDKLNEVTQATMETPVIKSRMLEIGVTGVAPDRRSPEYLEKCRDHFVPENQQDANNAGKRRGDSHHLIRPRVQP